MTTDAPKLPAPPVVGARSPDSNPSRVAAINRSTSAEQL